jgi:phage shock protein PspC (stress-responsive transcriptional regulator)
MEVQVVSYIHKTFESACNIFPAIWYFSVTKRGTQEYATGMSSTINTLNCLVWYSVFPYQTWQMDSLATCTNTGLFKMIAGVLTTCHTQYTWDRSICIFFFICLTLHVFVTYLTGALYVPSRRGYIVQMRMMVRWEVNMRCQGGP